MTKQELIDHLQHLEQYTHYSEDAPALREAIALLSQSYSTERTQERTKTHACDLIDRRDAIDAFNRIGSLDTYADREYAESIFEEIPSAQPDLDEWCTDCKEYDQERHSCPRWNRVIRQALKDAQTEPIRCKDCYWWTKQEDSLQGRCDRYGKYPTGYWFCASARERREE